jgi:hypothetical protein
MMGGRDHNRSRANPQLPNQDHETESLKANSINKVALTEASFLVPPLSRPKRCRSLPSKYCAGKNWTGNSWS